MKHTPGGSKWCTPRGPTKFLPGSAWSGATPVTPACCRVVLPTALGIPYPVRVLNMTWWMSAAAVLHGLLMLFSGRPGWPDTTACSLSRQKRLALEKSPTRHDQRYPPHGIVTKSAYDPAKSLAGDQCGRTWPNVAGVSRRRLVPTALVQRSPPPEELLAPS